MARKKPKQEAPLIKNGDDVTVAPGGFLGGRFGGKVIGISENGEKAMVRLTAESREDSTIDSAAVDVQDIDSVNGRPVYDVLLNLHTSKVAPVPGLDDAVRFANELRSEGQDEARVAWETLGRLAFSAKVAQQSMLRSQVQIIATAGEALKKADAMDELVELCRSFLYGAASNAESRIRMAHENNISSPDGEMTAEQEVLLRLRLLTLPVSDLKTMLNKSGLDMLKNVSR
jgi:hypothetical protein